jgi:hypothetical protein
VIPLEDGETCTDNYQCDSENCLDGECAPRGKAGGECSVDMWNQCDDDFYCEVETGEIVGECVPKKGPGEECDFSAQCPNYNCGNYAGIKRCGSTSSATEAMCDGLED